MALCQAYRTPTPPASRDPYSHASFLSKKTVRTSSISLNPGLHHTSVAQALAAPGVEPIAHVFANPGSKFAHVLGVISSLHNEVDEESRAAEEYMQRMTEESGRSIKDYERRAVLFKRSGEMVTSSKLKEERVMMELELLQCEVLERDEGSTATDYWRRAQIFNKSAEVFCRPELF